MNCLVCSYVDTRVIDSRVSSDGLNVRRRRECPKCAFRFSTCEQAEILDLTVIKSDSRRETYHREKLVSGLRRALEKRDISEGGLNELIGLIERDLQRSCNSEVNSSEIGEIVMKHLKKVDKVAYIRFASVYRAFEDLETFQEEVAGLVEAKKQTVKSLMGKGKIV